jgi:hypothetical protein
LCDGKTGVPEIARRLSTILGAPASEEVVWLALDLLSKENLLAKKLTPDENFTGLSRREVIRRIGLTSVVALPVISSLILPTAATAQSCSGSAGSGTLTNGCPCSDNSECASGCCDTSGGSGVCAPDGTGSCALGAPGSACVSGIECSSGCCLSNVCQADPSDCLGFTCGQGNNCPAGLVCCGDPDGAEIENCSAFGC